MIDKRTFCAKKATILMSHRLSTTENCITAMFRKGMLGPGIYHTNPASYVKARPQIMRWLEIAASD